MLAGSKSDMMHDKVLESFTQLQKYCKSEEYKGWDPYDGLSSAFFKALPILPKLRVARLLWIQLLKKLPYNLRLLLDVDKGFNPKGIALFISGYCKLSHIKSFEKEALLEIDILAEKLLSLQISGYSGICWGYNFDWQSRAFFLPKGTPNIIATSYAANSLLDAYEVTGNSSYLAAALESKEFIIKDLQRTQGANGEFCFSYSPLDKTSVFNASLHGTRLLSRIFKYTKETKLKDLTSRAIAYCCSNQRPDGSWFYSSLPHHQWIDNFHTGFNLECIYDYGEFTTDSTYHGCFDRGIDYYLNTFFDEQGRAKYFNNATYPVDIHSPSQLVITLSKCGLFNEHLELIDRTLTWTITHMQSAKGYFYFQKHTHYTNKIPYMRWSQAWIFYALATYLWESQRAVK